MMRSGHLEIMPHEVCGSDPTGSRDHTAGTCRALHGERKISHTMAIGTEL